MEDFKPRDQHIGPSTAHIGQSHRDKDQLEQAARGIDQGPSFGTPGNPPDADPDSIGEIEKAHENHEHGMPRAG